MKWLNENGSLNVAAFDELEAAVRAVTDSNRSIDAILRNARLGREMAVAFQCNHSGMHFPADYVKNWGKLYGIGLGPDPVSECLNSDYDMPVPEITPDIRSWEQIMHPLITTKAQVDMMEVAIDQVQYLVLAKDDPYLDERARIVRQKQLTNPRSRLRLMAVKWQEMRGALK